MKLALKHIPVYGAVYAEYLGDVVARRRRRAESVAEAFSVASGCGVELLLDRAKGSDRLSDMVADVLETAGRTRSQEKLRALGRALARGYLAEDDAALDESELLLAMALRLEGAHLRVLDHLVRRGSRYDGVPDYELARLFKNGVVVVYGLLKELESLGLAGPTSPPSGDPDSVIHWVPWDLGLLLHRELIEEGRRAL